jgi:hypothetical protein
MQLTVLLLRFYKSITNEIDVAHHKLLGSLALQKNFCAHFVFI